MDKFVHIKTTSIPAELVISEYNGAAMDGYETIPYTGENVSFVRGEKLCTYRVSQDKLRYETDSIVAIDSTIET